MSLSNLTVDGEFRYIVQWFAEWSELQREDFLPIIVEFLDSSAGIFLHMNGLSSQVATACLHDRPMNLFQCRVKLFREWAPKWPAEWQQKLKQKITEIDPSIGEKIGKALNGGEVAQNGENGIANVILDEPDIPLEAVLCQETSVDDSDEAAANGEHTFTPDVAAADQAGEAPLELEPVEPVSNPTTNVDAVVVTAAEAPAVAGAQNQTDALPMVAA